MTKKQRKLMAITAADAFQMAENRFEARNEKDFEEIMQAIEERASIGLTHMTVAEMTFKNVQRLQSLGFRISDQRTYEGYLTDHIISWKNAY